LNDVDVDTAVRAVIDNHTRSPRDIGLAMYDIDALFADYMLMDSLVHYPFDDLVMYDTSSDDYMTNSVYGPLALDRAKRAQKIQIELVQPGSASASKKPCKFMTPPRHILKHGGAYPITW